MEVERLPVLVVEDNDDDVFILRRAFRDSKLANPLFIVTDGQEALDYLRGHGRFADRTAFPFPSLVLLDLKLPFVSGLEVLEWIQSQPFKSSLLVIILTSSAEDRDIHRAYHLGARAYLTKPPASKTLRELMSKTDEALRGVQPIRRLPLAEDHFVRTRIATETSSPSLQPMVKARP